ncbi:unnamed protein product [Mytilus coruscus]|uniref:Uncharacterized protein n=1 Tax=Mytilus coruscus TaxID=42192 RepID=A0A6J8B0G2_MYTCO|nr:unnamed protein product [Mytilus coruscus]
MQPTEIVVPYPDGLVPTQQYFPITYLTEEIELADVYRVLRLDEIPEIGIFARDPVSTVGAAYHVAWGSSLNKKKSKYISTSLFLENAQRFAEINKKNTGQNCQIVRIALHNWKKEQDIFNLREKIDVWDIKVRNQIILVENPDYDTQNNFHKFAKAFNEVLLVGYVPPKYITKVQ